MSHRRRFLNMVISNDVGGMYSMRRVDLHAGNNSLFYPTTEAAAAHKDPKKKTKKMERIQARGNATLFSGRCTEWFPLSERKMVYMDGHSRAAVLYNSEERSLLDALPDLQIQANRVPIFLPVAGAGGEGDGGVYVMERSPKPAGEDGEVSKFQFQALVRRRDQDAPVLSRNDEGSDNPWRRDELPPPPYVHESGYTRTCIDSHVLIGTGASADGSGGVLCVSTEGVGTFCFDTARRTWSKAGQWALPFSGRIEHVPDLGVLVGFWGNEHGHRLCASNDLVVSSAAAASGGRRPVLQSWLDLEPPCAEWVKVKAPQLIGLGSGKFCLAEFFKTATVRKGCQWETDTDEGFAVLTGVEVVGRGHGGDGDEVPGDGGVEGGIRVIKHKSKRYVSTNKNNRSATVEFVL